MVKTKSKGLLKARLPHVLDYFYWNMNKDAERFLRFFLMLTNQVDYFTPNSLRKAGSSVLSCSTIQFMTRIQLFALSKKFFNQLH
jgi:hypothetical protein